ncbi:MexH family multidrug efflux RND transporter periplasmic adaptor subunit [Algimonas arctica]|uniref:MexH family multidrug efflux RND transporter periplasmic adaptor subunit n=1 Tax=Algimonas arctica TaxID=1479486 RepID=A0A8J3CUM0_9PROT|nr:efflux RND transporter periplasmic adaptor subunit [Algimonas arctica]GHB04416.1 MexH family multidrug efflux RND transporter periplasmic adaptor subunit [Algimonas arctica]
MKLNSSYLLAGAAILIVGAWFFIGSAGKDRDIYADIDARNQPTETQLPTVVVRTVTSEVHPIRLTSYGRTLPNRRVEVKAKTPASLVSTPVREGTRVKRGDIICRQDVDARQALVDQAKAQLAKAEADLSATTTLVEKGYRAPTSLNGDRAAVDGARASLKQAQIELGNVVLRAPFSGIYENRLAEVGDYLSPGMPCAAIVELDPLKLEAELTETQVGQVEIGQTVDIQLATGQTVTGTVSFIESVANPATRTFEMEMSVPNPDYALKAGVSATLNLKIGEAMASLVPSGVMALDENGATGIRYVDASDIVRFATIKQVDETQGGIWVMGIPARSRVIIEGQDYVTIGSKVDPRVESASSRDGASTAGLSSNRKLD